MVKIFIVLGTLYVILSAAVPALENVDFSGANIFNVNSQVAQEIK